MKVIRRSEVESVDRGGYYVRRLFTKVFLKRPEDVGFYETTIPKGSVCREQWHKKSYEVVYFLTPGAARLEGTEYSFEKGDLVILDPNEKHEWIALEDDLVVFALRLPHLLDDKYTTD